MALKFRVIARLDIRNDKVIGRVKFDGVRPVGDPIELVRKYDAQGADEIVLIDSVASLYNRPIKPEIVSAAAENAFCPITVGGGIRSLNDAKMLFNAGADKLAVNTAAIDNPVLIEKIAWKYGNQAVTLQIDAKQVRSGQYDCYTCGGRQSTFVDAIQWANDAILNGAGEIFVTSIDQEGTRQGFLVDLAETMADLPVPVVIGGGFGSPKHLEEISKVGISGVAIARDLHHNAITIPDIKGIMSSLGVPVRLEQHT